MYWSPYQREHNTSSILKPERYIHDFNREYSWYSRTKDRMKANVYKLCESVRTTASEDGLLLLEAREGRIFSLNPLGSKLWRMLEHDLSLEAIVDEISSQFNIPRETGLRDVEQFIAALRVYSLIEE